jgi:predicted DNA-binding transcriptional regulator AlpA
MPPIPETQSSPHPPRGSRKRKPTTPTAPATPQQRQRDGGSSDDAEARLSILVRFADLKAAGYVRNWPTLLRLIDDDGFPPGFLLGRNTRVWVLDDVQAWIAARPIARKEIPRAAIEAAAAARAKTETAS